MHHLYFTQITELSSNQHDEVQEDQQGSHCSTDTEQLSTTGAFSWCQNTQADFICTLFLSVIDR